MGTSKRKEAVFLSAIHCIFTTLNFFFYDCLPNLEKETKIENSKGYEIIKEVNDFNRNNTFNMETQKRDILVKTIYFQHKILW